MAYPGERSGSTAQANIVGAFNDVQIEALEKMNEYFRTAKTHRGHEESVARKVASMFKPYPSDLASDIDWCAGLDSSSYEGSFDEADANQGGYPSSRMGITQVSHQGVDLKKLRALNERAMHGACIDPKDLMAALKGEGQLNFWFCSSNLIPEGVETAADGFREALCNALRKPEARLPSSTSDEGREVGWSLMATYHHLLHQMGRLDLLRRGPIRIENGKVMVRFCAECEAGGNGVSGIIHPALALSPNRKPNEQVSCLRNHVLSELEILGLAREFSAELSNYPVFHRFGMVVEVLRALQILLAQTDLPPPGNAQLCPWRKPDEPPMRVGVLMDGGLTMFGRSQVLVPAVRAVVDQIISPAPQSKVPGQGLLFGVIKTGVVQNFLSAVQARTKGTASEIKPGTYWLIDVETRARWIMRQRSKRDELGPETHFGHEIAVKTHAGRLFLLSVPLPLPPPTSKDQTQASLTQRFLKAREGLGSPTSAQSLYLNRVLAVLETVQSSLFGASTVPQVAAHSHASLSWHPSGTALLSAVREARRSQL